MADQEKKKLRPGVCVPWDDRREEYPEIQGDEEIVKKVWEDMDNLAYLYIWFVLIQF